MSCFTCEEATLSSFGFDPSKVTDIGSEFKDYQKKDNDKDKKDKDKKRDNKNER